MLDQSAAHMSANRGATGIRTFALRALSAGAGLRSHRVPSTAAVCAARRISTAGFFRAQTGTAAGPPERGLDLLSTADN